MVAGTPLVVFGTVAIYLLAVLGIGEYARRRTRSDREDFFMASRSFGTVVLLFALLATNMTAFVLIGAPGLAYSAGVGAYGYVVGFATLSFPVVFGTVGYRLWLAGREFGHITPAQMFNHRFDSDHLGTLVMALMTFWTVPYFLLGAIGSGIAFRGLTQGTVPYWAGALLPLVIVFIYVLSGGMRGTGLTNVFQGAVFIVFLWGLVMLLASRLGGFSGATAAVMEQAPQLASRAGPPPFAPRMWFSFALVVTLNILMYPHMFRRILVALDERSLRRMVILYPIGLMLTWVPAVLVGFWGAGQIGDLTGQEVDQILPLLVGQYTPPLVIGLALAGILAAIMSSLDGQTLAVSTMFSEDIIRQYTDAFSEAGEIRLARVMVGVILAITFVLSLLRPGTIVGIAEFAFSGYALIFFPLVVGLYWRNANQYGAWVGLLWGFVGLWGFEIGLIPASLTFGFMAFIPVFVVQIVLTLAVGYFGPTPPTERVRSYFQLYDGVW